MNLSDGELTAAAMLFELGIPLLCVVAIWRMPRFRKKAVVILGAVTPALILYAWIVVGYVSGEKDSLFAILAAWVMTFFAYAVLVVVGVAASFLPKPDNLYARFAIGFATVSVSAILLKYVFEITPPLTMQRYYVCATPKKRE
jgi:hypothetical protein